MASKTTGRAKNIFLPSILLTNSIWHHSHSESKDTKACSPDWQKRRVRLSKTCELHGSIRSFSNVVLKDLNMEPKVRKKFGMSSPRTLKRWLSRVKDYSPNAKGKVSRSSLKSKPMICRRPGKSVRLLFAFASIKDSFADGSCPLMVSAAALQAFRFDLCWWRVTLFLGLSILPTG